MTNPPHNVELEAAKFLHKLIQDSKDEPKKLATKLHVILQHMRSSGKENSMPYQVISRAMETVIKQHELDIETLMSLRHPMAPSGAQLGESGSSQVVGSSPRAGVSKDPNTSIAGNELSKPDLYPSSMPQGGPSSGGHDLYPSGMPHGGPSSGGHDTPNTTGGAAMVHGMMPSSASSYPLGETGVSVPKHFASSSYDNHGFAGKILKEGIETFPSAASSMDPYTNKPMAGGPLEHEGVNLLPNPNKPNQASDPVSAPEISMSRNLVPRDTGKAPLAQAPVSGLPFKEHHLKQLRAQCLVFLAFRNGLMPKKLHLEIALGNFFPKEDGPRRDTNDHKEKEQSVHEQHSMPEVSGPTAGLDNTRGPPTGTSSTGIYPEANFSLGADNPNMKDDKTIHQAVPYEYYDERRPNLGIRRKPEFEVSKQERSESQASSIKGMQYESAMRSGISVGSRENDSGNNQLQHIMAHPASFVPGTTKYMRPEMSNWPSSEYQLEASRVAPGMTLDSQLRKENTPSQFQSPDSNSPGHRHADSSPSLPLREQWKPIQGVDGHNVLLMPSKNSDVLLRNALPDYHMDDQDASPAVDCAPSAKYTTFDYWVMDRQKRKFLADQQLAMKLQKTEEKKAAACSAKLKESATSSEDINDKTKSVIEQKKLKLLDLQRRVRSDIMNDYFKPITSDMDRLKAIKKHRIGRRSKQLERYEGKMKEERQKRMRERQKDFFSELEVHRERLEDVFKMRRERWKGFNRNVREFHKKKERIHREKIDRIQREKINLLKINDVEGYLRMVKDAKSDRVKQLLKETEKYLSKLGSKLQQAKNTARRFESDVDDGRNNTMVEKNEISFENEDETDQAKHYLESNEKYYLLAHSVKETVLEQPAMLVGGKLREYQMNGLRWLVSLYNNHLNGILADEMGLGKTVQVISLLCHLMETKNDRGPFLVVVPSSVLPGWETEINFWAPGLQKIVYSGPPEERRRLFKEQIISQKFNVLLTTYEYLMNKHDRPKLSKVQWHYIIIDEGHRIKNASCKLNADLKHYKSNHRLLLTGTPLQNNLEELWALLNFLLPNIFNSSEDFSQWFNKPFESNGDSSADEALLSEEENLLIINRLHQVLRPFVLRRLKHKVENELPEKIERLIRCEASGYQKLLMKRVEDNLGAFGASKVRSVHNSVMELRNICNHPYLSQLHIEEVHEWMPKHYLPNIIRLCGKLEMLDRLLPKLKETDHRVLLFSTMTRLLDVMEDYLCWKQYKYLRLDGHTSGGDRGALIDKFNQPGSPFFIFLLSIRAGGVGVNLQAADTVIIFDTDWNPQVDLQAQARAHRIGQKKDVLVLRLETVQTVEEQVRASAEHKLGVANQSITAGFFDNNTSAEDRREYLESLLRECKKEEAAPVLDDDGLNDVIARSESEIDVFESIDRKRRAEEREAWVKLIKGNGLGDPEGLPPLPSRLLMEDELKTFSEAMKIFDVPQQGVASNSGTKRKGDHLGGLDTRHYGRGKRAREVRSYEEQLTEEEFERLCQVEGEAPVSPRVKQEITPRVKEELTPRVKEDIAEKKLSDVPSDATILTCETQAQFQQLPPSPIVEPSAVVSTEVTPPSKRGRGRPRRAPTTELSSSPGVNQYSSGRPTTSTTELSPSPGISLFSSGAEPKITLPVVASVPSARVPISDMVPSVTPGTSISVNVQLTGIGSQPASLPPSSGPIQPTTVPGPSMPARGRGRGRKAQPVGEPPRRRGKRQSASVLPPPVPTAVSIQFEDKGEVPLGSPGVGCPNPVAQHPEMPGTTDKSDPQAPLLSASNSSKSDPASQVQVLGQPGQPNLDACSVSVGPQLLPVPNQSTAAASDAPSVSGMTTGASDFSLTQGPAPLGSSIMVGDAQDPAIMGSPSPNPVLVPSSLSTVSVSQAVALADPSPKQGRGRGRGRGRGQKAQSGVEAPKRRGKRQNPDEPATFEVSTVQDPKLEEVPEKKSRASIGRRPTRRSKQEQDLLNQSNALSSGDSPSITNLATDSKSEDKGANSTILFDAAPSMVSPVLQPVLEAKNNQAEKPTDGARTGVVQISEASVTLGSKVVSSVLQPVLEDMENQAEKPIDGACTGVVQISEASMTPGSKVVSSDLQPVLEDKENQSEKPTDGARTGMDQICEASMTPGSKVVSSDLQPALEDKENQSEKPTDGARTGIDQICEASMTPDCKVLEEHETHKSDASLMMPDIGQTLASEVEQEHMVSKPSSCAESDPSQIISNPSSRKIVNEADRLININIMDAPHSVLDPSPVVVNKDLLQASVEENTPQNKSDPSIGGVDKVDREIKSPEEADRQLEMNSEISKSVPRNVNSENKETVGQSDVSVVISGLVAVSEHASEERIDADMMNDVIESERSKANPDRFVEEISNGTQKIEADIQLDSTAVILKSDVAENEDKAPNIIINSIVCHSEDPLAGVVGEMDRVNEAKKETDVQPDRAGMSSGRDAAEIADEMSKDQSVSEIERGSSSVTPVSDILNVGSEENAMNKVMDDKELLQGSVTISTPPTEDKPVQVSNVPLVDICSEGGNLAAVSSFVTVASKVETLSETIFGEDGSKKIEQKGQLDGPKTTLLANEDVVAASSSEIFNEISDTHSDKMAEEHENKEIFPNQGSGSVLCDDGHVGAISESLPSDTGASSGMKDAGDFEIKATVLNKVPMLEHSTVTVSLQETPLPDLGIMAPVVGQVDVSNIENKENEHADHPANIGSTVEFLVQKQEVSEVTTGKADPEEVKNEKNILEHGLAVINDDTFSTSDGPDVESQKDIDEKTSCDGDELVGVILNSETCEMRPTGSSGKSENEPDVGNASNAETSAETLKASEKTTTINAECGNQEKLETGDQTVVQKECLARVDDILPVDSQSSEEKILPSDSVLETVNRVAPNAEVIEGKNTQNVTETDCPDNSLDTGDNPIGRNAPLSLQVASVDAVRAEVFVEEPGMMHKDSAIQVKGSEEVELEKIAVAELHEAQTGATAGTSQPKNGLEQLVEEYSDAD